MAFGAEKDEERIADKGQAERRQSRSYRILMIAPTSFFADYGCHVRILEEARILQKLGHQVTVVAYHNGNDVEGIEIRRTLAIPWRRHYEVGSSRHKIAFDILLGLRSLQLLLFSRFDLIHAHLHEGALIALLLGRLFRKPVVFDFQGSLSEEMIDHGFLHRNSILYQPIYRLERWIARTAPVVFTSSAHAEQILLEQFSCRPEQIRPLPDCVDTDTFQPATAYDATELRQLRERLGIPVQSKLIVYVGLLAEYQGTGLLLEAFQRILQEHRDVYLLLMGFPGIPVYAAKAEELGIRASVIFTGRVPYQVTPRYLALGDVAVAPKLSLTEGCGKLLNYMAVALPTVAFDTPVAREYLGRDGSLARRGDVENLASQLVACLFPPPEAATVPREAGTRLRRRAIQLFEWRLAGQLITATYADLLDDHHDARISSSPSTMGH